MVGYVGMKEVARAARVSQMTVSRVVRGEPTVKAATAEKINRFIKKLGYRQDPALSTLAAYRTRRFSRGERSILAFLETEKSSYNQLVLSGVRDEATRLGYSIETFTLPSPATEQRRLSQLLFHRGITGLLISPSSKPHRLEGWDWPHFSMVSIGAQRHEPPIHAVSMDYFQGMQTACTELQRLGHRRIGLAMLEELELRSGHLWLGSYLSISKPALKPLIFKTEEASPLLFQRWLASQRPSIVLTVHGPWFEHLERTQIPVAYLNDLAPSAQGLYIRLDPHRLGVESVHLLHLLMLRREFGLPSVPKMILLRGEWVPAPKENPSKHKPVGMTPV